MRRWVLAAFIVLVVAVSAALAQAPLEPNPKDDTAHLVGYDHLDMTWLWRWEETIPEFIYDRVRQELDLMNQYPEFTYAQDQALVYNVMEHYYPDTFKRIQYRVKTHNWIPISSIWTQGEGVPVVVYNPPLLGPYGPRHHRDLGPHLTPADGRHPRRGDRPGASTKAGDSGR